jgi:MoxR-like ATPase
MSNAERLGPEALARVRVHLQRIEAGLASALLDQGPLQRLVLAATLARGHVLLEGLPGLGKTELVKALAALLGLSFRRVQFTPDLLPSDLTGGPMLEERGGSRALRFLPGPLFAQVVLADEINRASPKTQSALLEAMQERSVTVLGETHALPAPFLVLATQNPIELEGTYPLPEAQLDRFLFRLIVERPATATLERILLERHRGERPPLERAVDEAQLGELFAAVDRVFLPPAVARWIARLVEASHPESPLAPELVKRYVRHGGSPRAAIGTAEAARAHALVCGRPHAGFEDVRAVLVPVLAHRLVLDYRARLDGVRAEALARELLQRVEEVEALPEELRRA